MSEPIQARVVSPTKVLYDGEAEMLACRTEVGEIAFYAHHVPLVGALDVCKLRVVQANGSEEAFAVLGGFVECRDSKVTVVSDVAIPVGEVSRDVLESERAKAVIDEEAINQGDSGDLNRETLSSVKRMERDKRWIDLLEEVVS